MSDLHSNGKNPNGSRVDVALSDESKVKYIEVTLQINTGNIIYGEFDNFEDAIAFIQKYHNNPQAILEKITPKKRPTKDE